MNNKGGTNPNNKQNLRKSFNIHDDQKSGSLLIDTKELQKVLGCGRHTSVIIGQKANAKVAIGGRVLWNTKRIETFVEEMSE